MNSTEYGPKNQTKRTECQFLLQTGYRNNPGRKKKKKNMYNSKQLNSISFFIVFFFTLRFHQFGTSRYKVVKD